MFVPHRLTEKMRKGHVVWFRIKHIPCPSLDLLEAFCVPYVFYSSPPIAKSISSEESGRYTKAVWWMAKLAESFSGTIISHYDHGTG